MSPNPPDLTAQRLAAIVASSDDAIIGKDLDGVITFWNRAAEHIFGFSAAEAIGQPITLIIPEDRHGEETEVLRRIRQGEAVNHFETVRRRRDGARIHISLTISPIRDGSGRVIGASTIARDVSERKRVEASLADLNRRLQALVLASSSVLQTPEIEHVRAATLAVARELLTADGYAIWNMDPHAGWRVSRSDGVSEAFAARILKTYRDAPVPPRVLFSEPLQVEDVADAPLLAEQLDAYRAEGIRSMLVFPLTLGGERSGTLVFYYRTPHRFEEVEVQTGLALANLAAAAMTTAELYDKAEQGTRRAAFLAEAGSLLAQSLDYEQILSTLAKLAVPHIADWCAVDMVREDGSLARLAVAHVDPAKAALGKSFLERHPEDPQSRYGGAYVLRTSAPVMVAQVPDELLAAPARDADYLRAMQELGLTSYMCVPLRAHGRILGVLTFGSATAARRYDHDDLRFAEDVAARAALAVENARAYGEARRLAQELRSAEHRATQLIDSIPGIVWEAWWQPDAARQRVDFVSSYVRTLLGYTVEEWLQTPNFWLSLVHPDDREQAMRTVVAAAAGTEPPTSQYRWVTRDGRTVWAETRAAVIRDERGQPVGMRGVTLDITDRKRAEEERARLLERERQARAEADQANRAKDEFLAIVSHELRTPLNAIVGYVRMLRMQVLDPAQQVKALATIDRNAVALQQMIEDVLDVSRIITGKLRLNVQPVQLADLVADAVATVMPAAEAKGVRLQSVIDTGLPQVSGDPGRLQQVVWNLLSNAVKFTPRGGRAQLRLERVNSHVEIVVSDTGQGIEPEFLPHVFERFRQADSRFSRPHGGLGLGLAIVRQIVELHGGTVTAASEGAGTGATFRVRLPLMIVHPDPQMEQLRVHARDDGPPPDGMAPPATRRTRRVPASCSPLLLPTAAPELQMSRIATGEQAERPAGSSEQ